MDSCRDTLAGGLPHSDIHGSKPARGSPWLFAACHVLHRLLVPRHPPNALIILDTCPSACRWTHHAQKPSSDCLRDCSRRPPKTVPAGTIFAHNRILPDRPSRHPLAQTVDKTPKQSLHTPLTTRRRPLGRLSRRTALPVRHAAGQRDLRQPLRIDADRTRPETHQNLIHHVKEQTRAATRQNASFRRITTPISDIPRYEGDLSPGHRQGREIVVETIGIEPTTPCLQSRCSPS